MRRYAMLSSLAFAACTAGGIPTSSGGGGGVTINISLTQYAPSQTPYGSSRGYSPAVTDVAVGSQIHFVNVDSFAHTATAIPGATTFPTTPPFNAGALQQKGTSISGNWSTGALQASGSSQTITVDRAGTYLYGCFFHYGAGMRGAIVAQ